MLTAEQQRAKLEMVLREIRSRFDIAEIRGGEDSGYIYAEKQKLAVEVYQAEHNVMVEFWENEELLAEKEVNSYEKAAKLIVDWIQSKD